MEKQLRILVVDDDAAIRDLFKRILSSKDYTVITADDGEMAVESAKKDNFDVVFLDMRMPKMDGLETFRALKDLYPDINIVIMTGFAEYEKIDLAISEGAIESLRKPFDVKTIKASIAKATQADEKKLINVLVVDDDPVIRKLFEQLKDPQKYSITTTEDAEQALELLEQTFFDVAFLDIVLPGKSGISLCEDINVLYPLTKVILCSGYEEKFKIMEKKVVKRPVSTLKKPFDIHKIREILENIKSNRSAEL